MLDSSVSICLVTAELESLENRRGVGTHYSRLARLLAAHGWRVHVLYCGKAESECRDTLVSRILADGIAFSTLSDFTYPHYLTLDGGARWFETRSEKVRHALKELHVRQPFDLVEFPEWGGLGFRPMQARRMGLALQGTGTVVKLHGSSRFEREQHREWMDPLSEPHLNYCERYSFERSRFQASTSSANLEHARSACWAVREDACTLSDLSGDETQVLDFYRSCLNQTREERGTTGPTSKRPLVTVVVPYYNLGAYLPETLASLAGQTYQNLDVIVIDDGSTDALARHVFEEQKRRYPDFRFITQPNAGLSETRNRGLREARGEFYIPVDADNIALPRMVERFVSAMIRNPELSGLSAYFLAFRETEDMDRGEFLYASWPTGGPHLMACDWNIYGDANSIFRTAVLRAVNGYEPDRDSTCEDWELFVKLVNAGHQVDVLPEILYYYRHRQDSLLRTTSWYMNYHRVYRQFYRAESLPGLDRKELWTVLVNLFRCHRSFLQSQWEMTQAQAEMTRTLTEKSRALAESTLKHEEMTRTQAEMSRAYSELCTSLEASLERERVQDRELRSRGEALELLLLQERELRSRAEVLERQLNQEREHFHQLRYRLLDWCNRLIRSVPLMHRLLKSFVLFLKKTSNAPSPT